MCVWPRFRRYGDDLIGMMWADEMTDGILLSRARLTSLWSVSLIPSPSSGTSDN